MIKLIVAPAGEGKTKMLTQLANEDAKKAKGHLVYMDSRNKRMLDVDYKIRFINTSEYKIENGEQLYAFICGIVASNYDIETIYIDGLYKITNTNLANMESFFRNIENIELKYNINLVITISSDKNNLPEFLTKYSIL